MSCDVSAAPYACTKGGDVTLYYNVSGNPDAPVWIEHLGMVEDLDINEVEELQEFSNRDTNRQVKQYNEGEIELSVTGTQIHDPNYEGWQALNSARRGGAPIDCVVLGGKIDTLCVYGWWGGWWNSDRTMRGPAVGNCVNAVNLQPASSCNNEITYLVQPCKVATTAGTVDEFDPTTWTPITRP